MQNLQQQQQFKPTDTAENSSTQELIYDYIPEENQQYSNSEPTPPHLPTITILPTEQSIQFPIQTVIVPFPRNILTNVASTESYLPANENANQFDVLYDSFGNFLFETSHWSRWGCDLKRVQETFKQAGELTFQNYTLPLSSISSFQVICHCVAIIFVVLIASLPWISVPYWNYGVITGSVCIIVAFVLYLLFSLCISIIATYLQHIRRKKVQQIVQAWLTKEMTDYYQPLGISLSFYYHILPLRLHSLYSPRITVSHLIPC